MLFWGVFFNVLRLVWMCDECTWHHKTFLVQLYWHLAVKLYCVCVHSCSAAEWTTIATGSTSERGRQSNACQTPAASSLRKDAVSWNLGSGLNRLVSIFPPSPSHSVWRSLQKIIVLLCLHWHFFPLPHKVLNQQCPYITAKKCETKLTASILQHTPAPTAW